MDNNCASIFVYGIPLKKPMDFEFLGKNLRRSTVLQRSFFLSAAVSP